MELNELLERFTKDTIRIIGNDLVGVYLHGSAVMGCFNPEKSDVDLMIVVDGELSKKTKRAFMDMVVEMNAYAPEKGIEMSIVRKEVCSPFVYPTPFELHFSNMHIGWYTSDPDGYVEHMNGTDIDLAAHFTIINSRGRTLFGKEIKDVFAPVPHEDYFDSICADIEEAPTDILENPVYITLNLCRVLAYKNDSLIRSKAEGGKWGEEHLPEAYRPLIEAALEEYSGGKKMEIDKELAAQFAEYMLEML